MKTGATKPEWDTPPDGDFARYVEQLTARPAPGQTVAGANSLGAVARGARASTLKPATAAGGAAAAVPPDLVKMLLPWVAWLRPARRLLLGLTALHGLALFALGWGSLPALLLMGAAWWVLGSILVAAPKVLSSAALGATHGAEPLQERLRQLAQQRNPRKKTPL